MINYPEKIAPTKEGIWVDKQKSYLPVVSFHLNRRHTYETLGYKGDSGKIKMTAE
jgi:hypothetical protein